MDDQLFAIKAPPPSRRTGGRNPALQAARDYADLHPGVWLRVRASAGGAAVALRRKGYKATIRNIDRATNQCDLYLRRPEVD